MYKSRKINNSNSLVNTSLNLALVKIRCKDCVKNLKKSADSVLKTSSNYKADGYLPICFSRWKIRNVECEVLVPWVFSCFTYLFVCVFKPCKSYMSSTPYVFSRFTCLCTCVPLYFTLSHEFCVPTSLMFYVFWNICIYYIFEYWTKDSSKSYN